ncbi:MAG: hypothetical protein MZV63_50215 [Marinilabiliales bacterium]|nr:hypothetical protein [Marinilabiliales bacterium]
MTFDEAENSYYVDENNDGTNDYSFENPDYNYDRVSLKPGCTLGVPSRINPLPGMVTDTRLL